MTMSATNISDYQAIGETLQHYIDGARTGKGDMMKPAFHAEATIFGYVGPDLFAGPIQGLFDWNDKNGPAKDIVAKIVSIDVIETIATVRVEADNWTGHRFSDFFTLLKVDGQWKIMNKVFHLHG
jgi:Putative lumazine-binding